MTTEAPQTTRQAVEAEEAEQAAVVPFYEKDARLAIREDQANWTPMQMSALRSLGIKATGPKAPTEGDLAVYFSACQRTGLDPFMRQIYLIARKSWDPDEGREVWRQTIQVGIDGFRVQRDRAARRDRVSVEFEETVWYDATGKGFTEWLWDDITPTACKVVLLKDGYRFPAVLRTAAYIGTKSNGDPVGRWAVDCDHQIEKCCEAFASRRAFPADLGGLYIEEEMENSPMILGPSKAPAKSQRLSPPRQEESELDRDQAVADASAKLDEAAERDAQQANRRSMYAMFRDVGLAGDKNRPVRNALMRVLGAENIDATGPIAAESAKDLTEDQVALVDSKVRMLVRDRGADKLALRKALRQLASIGGHDGPIDWQDPKDGA